MKEFKLMVGYDYVTVRVGKLQEGGISTPSQNLIELDPNYTRLSAMRALLHEIRHHNHVQTGMVEVLEEQMQEADACGFSHLVIQILGQFDEIEKIMKSLDGMRET